MLYENRVMVRRVLILGLSALIIIPILIYLITLLTTGTVTIKTAVSSNYINLEQIVGDSKGKLYSQRAQGELSARLKPGEYQVTVSNSNASDSFSKNITIKARKHLSLTINPVAAKTLEPVYSENAGSVFSDGSQLLLISLSPSESVNGAEDGNIVRATSAGFTTLFPSNDFSEVQWINGGLGLAQDSNNNLYLINGGALTHIALPFGVATSTKLSSSMSKNGSIYVTNGKEVYVGTASGGFKKIYTAGDEEQITNVLAGNNKVAVVMGAIEAIESTHNGSQPEGAIALVDNSGRAVSKSLDVSQASWSADGKYLIAEGALSSTIFDASLNQVKTIAINNSDNFTWLNDSSVFYTINNQLWLYNLQTAQSTQVTSAALGESILGIYPSQDGSYVYLSISNSAGSQLFKVGLQGQPTDKSLISLSIIMPEVVDSCALDYINFDQPTILVVYPASVTQQACQITADSQLVDYNLNPSKFQFLFTTQAGD